ncbi:MAG: hypothetical protein ACK5B6_02675, partial [Bacteroidia bacterium]
MIRVVFCLLACHLSLGLFSQDLITLRSGKTLKVQIQEVNQKEIAYRKADNANGPLYKIYTRDVLRIDYESGAVDNFAESQEKSTSFLSSRSLTTAGRNILSIDAMALLFQNIELSYEYLTGDDKKLGVRVPVSVNMQGTSNNGNMLGNTRNVFYSGLDLNYYPLGQNTSSFFVGPSLRIGSALNYNEYFDPLTGGFTNERLVSQYFSFLLRFGYLYTPV